MANNNNNKRQIEMRQKNNLYNYTSDLFKKLTKLFSSPIVQYRHQTEKTLRNKAMNKYASKFYDTSGQSFKKSEFNPFENMSLSRMVNHQRALRYSEFTQMEFDPDLAAALDLYSEEMTTFSSLDPIMKIKCSNEEIREILHTLYFNILNIEFNLFAWCRGLCKYGDFFLYLDTDDDEGIKNVIGLPTEELERIEGEDQNNPNYVQFQWNVRGVTFENWQVAHFRILGNDKYAPYGSSILDPARRIFRQKNLLEDAMMAYRIVRCLHGESKIWTNSGYKEMKDIEVGDKVYSYDYKDKKFILSNVIDWVDNGVQQIWEVKSKHRTIKMNDNHPLLVKNKNTNEIEYVLVKDLIPKVHQINKPKLELENYISTPIQLKEEKYEWFGFLNDEGKEYFKTLKYEKSIRQIEKEIENEFSYKTRRISQFLYHKNKIIKGIPYDIAKAVCKKYDIPEKYLIKYPKGIYNIDRFNFPNYVDEKFARFFGFMIGDGFMTKNKHKIGFATGIYEDNNDYYMNIFKDYCSSVVFSKDKRNKKYDILGKYETNSSYMCNLFEDMGFTSNSYTKIIPNWVFNSSPFIKEAFIDGLCDADAHIRIMKGCKDISYSIEMCNKKIIDGLKELCHQLGWNVSSKVTHYKNNIEENTMIGSHKLKAKILESYYLYFTKRSSEEYENIYSIEKTNEYSNVYDIRVDNEIHNFIADGCVVHNSPERKAFYIDVGNIPPQDVETHMQKIMTQMKRTSIADSDTGRIDLRYNPLSIEDDYFIPVRAGSQTKIESIPGGSYTGDIDDVKYLRDKLYSAIKIPMSYLSRGEGSSEDKQSLAQKDIRFARTIQRLQRSVISELEKIGIVHLFMLGFRGEDLLSFKLALNNPSKITDLQELEHWRTKFDVASAATEGFFSRRWISENLFNMSDEEFLRNQRELFYDKNMDKKWEVISSAEGGEGGGLGGDLGGDLGTEESSPEEEEEDILLAKPEEGGGELPAVGEQSMQEDKDSYLTPRAKGKFYTPEKFDKRGMGARKRHMQSMYSHEKSSDAKRNLYHGVSDIMSLAKGISENKDSIYIEEEKQLLRDSHEVKLLIELLEKRNKKDENDS